MSLTLADRLSSPQGTGVYRQSFSRPSTPSLPEEFGENFDPYAHLAHLPVQEQIDALFDEEKKAYRRRQELLHRALHPKPIVPRRKPLLPTPPRLPPVDRRLVRRPLPETTHLHNTQQVLYRTLPYVDPRADIPLIDRISGVTAKKPSFDDFRHKKADDIVAILTSKVGATIKRYQAIVDKKHLIADLPGEWQHALYDLGRCLNWVAENLDSAPLWSFTQRRDVATVCSLIGDIKFREGRQSLEQRFNIVAKELYQRVWQGNYLVWIDVTKRFGDA